MDIPHIMHNSMLSSWHGRTTTPTSLWPTIYFYSRGTESEVVVFAATNALHSSTIIGFAPALTGDSPVKRSTANSTSSYQS